MLGEQRVRVPGLLQRGIDPPGEVVVGVVAAEEHAVVQGPPVVVELVAGVGQPLPPAPADLRQLGRRQRLGHEHVVVDRQGEEGRPAQQPAEGAGAEHDLVGADAPPPGAHLHPGPGTLQAEHLGALVDLGAEPLGVRGQPPGEPRRVDEPDARVAHPGQRQRGVHHRPAGVHVEQLGLDAVLPVLGDRLGQVVHLVLAQREGHLAGGVHLGVDPGAVDARVPAGEVLRLEPADRRHVLRPQPEPLGEAVGQRGRGEAAVAPGGGDRHRSTVEHDDPSSGVLLQRLHRGPQPGVAGADDDEVGAVTAAGQRRPRVRPQLRPVGPVDRRAGVGERPLRPGGRVGLDEGGAHWPGPAGPRAARATSSETFSQPRRRKYPFA